MTPIRDHKHEGCTKYRRIGAPPLPGVLEDFLVLLSWAGPKEWGLALLSGILLSFFLVVVLA